MGKFWLASYSCAADRQLDCNLGLPYPDEKSRPLPLDGAVGQDPDRMPEPGGPGEDDGAETR